MQTLRSIRYLLRRPNVATSPVSMQAPSSPSRPLQSFIASPALRWWPPAFARRSLPLVTAPNPSSRSAAPRLSQGPRSTSTRVQGDESGKPYRPLHICSGKVIHILQGAEHSTTTQGMKNLNTDNAKKMKNIDTRGAISEVDEYTGSEKDVCRTALEVIDGKHDALGQNLNLTCCKEGQKSATKDHTAESVISDDGFIRNNVLAGSNHCDGSMYKNMDLWWKTAYRIADRNETRLEAMMYSDPSDCTITNGTCSNHAPCCLLQIFSLELAKLPVDGGKVELYGYIAVRDDLDPLLNYVVNISRDDPITLEEGSLIKMAGPKRGIYMMDLTLIEYDMRIKTGQQEKDDIPLIDGASLVGPAGIWNKPFIFDISSDFGAVDITLSRLANAVEATVEVLISDVQSSFILSLCCLTSGFTEEIRLIDGAIAESCGLKRFVVAVVKKSWIDLKFNVGAKSSSFDQYRCSFKGKIHGHDTQEIKTDFALIMVKVTWSAFP